MNKIVKTVVILLAGITLATGTAVAAPHHYVRPVRVHRCAPPPPPPRLQGPNGGIVGGIVGALAN